MLQYRIHGPLGVLFLVALMLPGLNARAEKPPKNRLTHLEVQESKTHTQIFLRGTAPPSFTVFKLRDPIRIYIDISNADISGLSEPVEVENGVIEQLTPLQFRDEVAHVARLIISLQKDVPYSVRALGNSLKIQVDASKREQRRPLLISAQGGEGETEEALAETQRRLQKEAQARAQAEAKAESAVERASLAEAKARAEAARAAQAEERARLEAEARVKAEQEAKSSSLALREAQEKVRREGSAQAKALKEAEQKLRAEAVAKSKAEAAARLEERARIQAEKQIKAERKARAKLESLSRSRGEEWAEAERALKRRIESREAAHAKAEQASQARQEAERRVQRETKARAEAEERAKAHAQAAKLAEGRAEEALKERERAEQNSKTATKAAAQAEERAQRAATERRKAERRILAESKARQEAEAQLKKERRARREAEARADARGIALERIQRDTDQVSQKRGQEQERLAQTEARAKRAEAEVAEARAAEARARAAVAQAEARAKAAEARAYQAEGAQARSLEAHEARARVSEERARQAESELAEAVARAEAARAEADAAQAGFQALSTDIASVQREAEARVRTAEQRAEAAKRRAEAAAAEARSSQKRGVKVEQRAQEAERRASAADDRAREASQSADLAQARAQRAEARIQAAEARRLRLEDEARNAQARVQELESAREALKQEIRSARKAKDKSTEALLKAESRSQEAEVKAEQARLAQLRSAREFSILDEQLSLLQDGLAEAQRSDSKAEVSQLKKRMASLEAESRRLKKTLATREEALEIALAHARKSQRESEQLQVVQRRSQEASKKRAQARKESAERRKAAKAEKKRAAEAAKVAKEKKAAEARRVAKEKKAAEARRVAKEKKARRVAKEKKAAEARRVARKEKSAETDRAAQQKRGDRRSRSTQKSRGRLKAQIKDLRFSDNRGESHITLLFDGSVDYKRRQEGEHTRILELQNALIDSALERSLDTSDFPSAVRLVSSFQAPPPGDTVRIVVTLGEGVKDEIKLGSDSLTWIFQRPTQRQKRSPSSWGAVPPPPVWEKPVAPREISYAAANTAVYTGPTQLNTQGGGKAAQNQARRPRFKGRKINLDVKDGDVHNTLRFLAKEGNINMVISDEVTGTVTLHLKMVPLDQAMDIVLKVKGLDMVKEGNIVRVAPAAVIALERAAEVKKNQVKEQLKPLSIRLVTINHASAADLLPRVKSVMSKRSSAEYDKRTNTIILKDVSDYLDAAEDMIHRLDTQTPQVQIEARIVEINSNFERQLGIQWGGDALMSPVTGNATGLRFPSTIGVKGGASDAETATEGTVTNPNFVVNMPAAAGSKVGGALGLTFGSIDSTFNLNVRLSAMETRGTAKIVSSPKITTLDNRPATISQGVSIPISQVSAQGIQTQFFDATLSLKVEPHVTQDGNIYLKINATNNTPDFQNVGSKGDPSILRKEATTELLLKDGDTSVIGGIYTRNSGFNRNEVPYLGRIPILGALFRNNNTSDRRNEMLIFVTPRIVNRSASVVRTVR